MSVFVISYDLNRPGKDYESLYSKIKSYGTWCHPVDSTWYIRTTQTARQVAQNLLTAMDANDSLVVSEVGRDQAWFGLPTAVSQWLAAA